ncbi:unnamed protein product [Nippostrongylus brasiliensis]|uniref:Uncharacterized protein n=1 Tax=Nippostrongylus brasiliensis TaxID=27835 RepID=A0A0N4XL72_NIPBR|nr:unnamed protein product [Nippostrongylus brasiliensis]
MLSHSSERSRRLVTVGDCPGHTPAAFPSTSSRSWRWTRMDCLRRKRRI